VERMRHEPLGALLELLLREVADVVSRGEHITGAADHYASRVERARVAGARRPRRARRAGASRSLQDDERVTFGNRLSLLADDLLHRAGVLGLDGHLHLHGLEDYERVALLDLLTDLALDLPDRPCDVSLDVGQPFLLRVRVWGSGAAPYRRDRLPT